RDLAAEHVCEGVRERPVTDIVEKARGLDQFPFLGREVEGLRHLAGDMPHTEAMLDPGVVRARKDEVRQPELPDRIEPLQLQGLKHVEGERLQTYRTVNLC